MKKRIVMIGTRFDTMGGIASVVNVYRAGGLFERFHILYLATHCDGGAGAKLAIALRALCAFGALVLRGQVGILHIHVSSRASFWRKLPFFILARWGRAATVVHLHSGAFPAFYQQCRPWRQKIIRYVFDHASRVIVLSETWKTWLQTISANRHIVAIYNPVLLPEQAAAAGGAGPRLLMLGRLGKGKGSYDLLAALARLRPRFPQLALVMGGDGEIQQVQLAAQEAGVAGQVRLPGWVSGAAKDSLLHEANIYLLPSYHEGLPMSLLEAMARGLPVISTPVGGIPEAVTDGVEGFLVAPGDVGALAERLTDLLLDVPRAMAMGAAGRDKIRQVFSAEAVLPAVAAVYEGLGLGAGEAVSHDRQQAVR